MSVFRVNQAHQAIQVFQADEVNQAHQVDFLFETINHEWVYYTLFAY